MCAIVHAFLGFASMIKAACSDRFNFLCELFFLFRLALV